MKWLLLPLLFLLFSISPKVFARITPNDIYQEKKAQFEKSLSSINDPAKQEKVVQANQLLDAINQKVCDRFLGDVNKLSAIMDELKKRQGIKETRVAYGQVDTLIENADYWVNWAAEAIAYQRAQEYIPQFNSEAVVVTSIKSSSSSLTSDLQTLKGKVLKAKAEVKKALNQYEK